MSSLTYRTEIDGLRALAILPVLMHHSGFHFLPGGFLGVDVFFVISGYLITSILMKEINAGNFSFISFYERRARRILPALFFMLTVVTFISLFILEPRAMQQYGQSLIAVTSFLANIYFYFKVDYFNPVSELNPLLHMWSLAVEEQYYIFFPVVMLIAVRFKLGFGLLFILIFVTSFIWMFSNINATSLNFYMLHARAWELAAGSIAAWLLTLNSVHLSSMLLRNIIVISAFIGLVVGYFFYQDSFGFPGPYSLVPVLSTFLIIIFCNGKDLLSRLLSLNLVVFIGLISYSLYLWHQPMFSFMRILTLGEFGIIHQLLAIFTTFLFSYLSYRYIESPLRKVKLTAKKVFAYTLSTIFVFTSIGGVFSNYLKLNIVSSDAQIAMNPSRGFAKVCDYEGEYTQNAECQNAPNATIMVWGDSYAMHLVTGLSEKFSLIQATKNACSPNAVITTLPKVKGYDEAWANGCLRFNKDVVTSLKQSRHITTVVISSTFEQWLQYTYWDGVTENQIDFEKYILTFKLTLNELITAGKKVIVVSPPPKNGKDIGQCLARSTLGLPTYSEFYSNHCTFTVNEQSLNSKKIFAMLDDIKQLPNVTVVDLKEYLCRDLVCATSKGVPFYLDAGHLNDYGSRYVADYIKEFVVQGK